MKYTGNALHPTQKAVTSLTSLIRAFTLPGDVVLDALCGSASTCAAALLTGREYIGIELDDPYYAAASARLDCIHQRIAAKRSAGALADSRAAISLLRAATVDGPAHIKPR